MRIIRLLVWKEFLQVFRDPATAFQILVIPIFQLLILSNAATFDVPRAAMLVVDEDHSSVSAQLIQRLDGSERFRVVDVRPNETGVEAALLDRDARVILRIPHDFERDLVRTGSAPVLLSLDAEDGASAGILQAAATAIMVDVSRDLAAAHPGSSREMQGTVRAGPPLDVRSSNWFNPSANYKHFMVPGLLVSLTTIIGLLVTSQNIVREKELGTLEQLNVSPISRGQFLVGKLLPFWLLAMTTFTIGMTVGVFVFGIPTVGSVPLVFLSAGVYLIVALGIGLLISTIARTQQQVMFVAFFLLLLYLLLSGIFTPLESAPRWAQWIAQASPVKHFVFIMRTVLVRGGGLADIGPTLLGLAVAGVGVMLLAVRQHSRRAD